MKNGKMVWGEMSQDEFDALPESDRRAKRNEMWEPIMDALEAGKSLKIDVVDELQARHRSRSVIRRGQLRGYRVEVRKGDGFLAVRKTEDLDKPVKAGRPRKSAA